MRRLLSILLLAVFGLPLAMPLFAAVAPRDAGLPMCCRKAGKHRCAMTGVEAGTASVSGHTTFRAMPERCPYGGCRAVAAHTPDMTSPPADGAIYAGVVAHPAGMAQTRSLWRIARSRARQKRGPPSLTTLL